MTPDAPTVHFWAYGTPVPKGSTRAFVRGGRAIVTSDAKGLGAWQRTIRDAAQAHAESGYTAGPVRVVFAFRLPRPKSLPKSRPTAHTKRPDLDKLIRSGLDALTGVLWADDAQVHAVTASKAYAPLEAPVGVEVSIWHG